MHQSIEQKEPIAQYIEATDVLLQGIRDMRLSPVPGLSFEAALLTLCKQAGEKAPESKRIERAAKVAPWHN